MTYLTNCSFGIKQQSLNIVMLYCRVHHECECMVPCSPPLCTTRFCNSLHQSQKIEQVIPLYLPIRNEKLKVLSVCKLSMIEHDTYC